MIEIVPALGNTTSYFATSQNQIDTEGKKKIYLYKKEKNKRKIKIGGYVKRVGYCGVRKIRGKGNTDGIQLVQGEKGGYYYRDMQRCGCVWFCPNCMAKLMKVRSEELYEQLKYYNEKGYNVLFITFTLQHNKNQSLELVHKTLLDSYQFANSHRDWVKIKKETDIEWLRALEVLNGNNGWHSHLHTLFIIGDNERDKIDVFINLYKKRLSKIGLKVNEHTVVSKKWNGEIDDMKDYLFKGMIEKEITGGNLKKTNKGDTFFDLIDKDMYDEVKEYVKTMKGKRQYHHSKNFFQDVRVKTDKNILKDDKIIDIVMTIPKHIFNDMVFKGIALDIINEYEYNGFKRVIKYLELYDINCDFLY